VKVPARGMALAAPSWSLPAVTVVPPV